MNRRDHLNRLIHEWNALTVQQKVDLMTSAPELYGATAWLVRTEEAKRTWKPRYRNVR